jgi:FkbM family methyltransferase
MLVMDKKLIRQLLKKDDPTILEIGSHKGSDTLEFLQEFPRIKIYSFEPDPRVIPQHRNLVSDPRSQLYELALSDQDGEAVFYQSGVEVGDKLKHDASSSLKKPREHLKAYPKIPFNNSTTVKTMRLDTWAKKNNITEVDFIWADVQGAEEQLIKGGLETLAKTKYFYTEYSDRELYEDQINLKTIQSLIPEFKFICFYASNVLFKNSRYLSSELEIFSNRVFTNYSIYTQERNYFRLPFKTGLRKLYYQITGKKTRQF